LNKTFYSILILLIIGFSISQSQLIRSYGIKAGIASVNQNWDWGSQTGIVGNSNERQGLDAGVFVEWLDIPLLSVVTEIHYIQKISDITTNVMLTKVANNPQGYIDEGYAFTPRLNYLSIPLLIKVRYDLPILSIYLLAGPRIDFFLSEQGDELAVSSNDYQKENIGGTFGMGFATLSIERFNIGVEFRYSPNYQKSYSSDYLSIDNQSMEFLLVLCF
jgi:hypothetical protein